MNKEIFLSIVLLIFARSLFAQSKKELNLRIDSLQIELIKENQIVENLALQLQCLNNELAKKNQSIRKLLSHISKQDSVNQGLQIQVQNLQTKIETMIRNNDSIRSIRANEETSDSASVIDKYPEISARLFLDAFLKRDYKEAKKYCCCEMIEILNSKPTLLQLEKSFADDKITIEGIGNSKIYYNDNEKKSCSIEFETFVNGNRKDGIGLKMKKKNNLWFVSVIK